jgi:hypothetical protein
LLGNVAARKPKGGFGACIDAGGMELMAPPVTDPWLGYGSTLMFFLPFQQTALISAPPLWVKSTSFARI